MRNRIVVKGARRHNLRDVSVEFPWDALTVCAEVSGSGKSSLAFDAIFVEGQRRYVESLSAYARRFLGQLDKRKKHSIDVVVDRLAVRPGVRQMVLHGAERQLQLACQDRFAGYLREVPCAACGGGSAVAEDTPEHVSAQPRSHTGRFLNSLLEHR